MYSDIIPMKGKKRFGDYNTDLTVSDPWVQIPLEKGTAITSVFLPGEFHGQRSLVGYSPWGCKELDTTEQLTVSLHFSPAPEGTPEQRLYTKGPE